MNIHYATRNLLDPLSVCRNDVSRSYMSCQMNLVEPGVRER